MSDQQRSPSADDKAFEPSGAPNALPAGEAFKAEAGTWYNLRVHYQDRQGNPTTGLMYPLAPNPATSFYEYMCLGFSPMGLPPAKFKVETMGGSPVWDKWTLDDGNVVSLKATGWVYRSSAYPIGWKIVGNRLYNSYWHGPVGFAWRSTLVPDACYMGMDLTDFTCELVPATDGE